MSQFRETLATMEQVPENITALIEASFREAGMDEFGQVEILGLPTGMSDDDTTILDRAMATLSGGLLRTCLSVGIQPKDYLFERLLASDDMVVMRMPF